MSAGAVAAGHPETARAAAIILEAGGNAFDAALAALCAACIAEPVLASFGGGGYLLAHREGGETAVYDFFAHTPSHRKPAEDLDFRPIHADFGTTRQEFHIGLGSMATPGTVAGLFRIHRDLGSMPLARIVEPAMALARDGVRISRLQAYFLRVLAPICLSSDACRELFARPDNPTRLLAEGDIATMAEAAAFLDALIHEGAGLFYRGDVAARIAADCAVGGGTLSSADLSGYRVFRRRPLEVAWRDGLLAFNPPPSVGGILIAFALDLLGDPRSGPLDAGSLDHARRLATVMELTNKARLDGRLVNGDRSLLRPAFVETYRRHVLGGPSSLRGTTHVSVIDGRGNAAGLSLSNGEGSGYVVPGTGIMMNNMLGEEDINPRGFHRWPLRTRIGSMMAPTLARDREGGVTVLGSGGSNRLRTAVLQVLINLGVFGMSLEQAVGNPRIHYESGRLSVEPGLDEGVLTGLAEIFPDVERWEAPNLFFGGVHAVARNGRTGRFAAAGDPRRGGAAVIL